MEDLGRRTSLPQIPVYLTLTRTSWGSCSVGTGRSSNLKVWMLSRTNERFFLVSYILLIERNRAIPLTPAGSGRCILISGFKLSLMFCSRTYNFARCSLCSWFGVFAVLAVSAFYRSSGPHLLLDGPILEIVATLCVSTFLRRMLV